MKDELLEETKKVYRMIERLDEAQRKRNGKTGIIADMTPDEIVEFYGKGAVAVRAPELDFNKTAAGVAVPVPEGGEEGEGFNIGIRVEYPCPRCGKATYLLVEGADEPTEVPCVCESCLEHLVEVAVELACGNLGVPYPHRKRKRKGNGK